MNVEAGEELEQNEKEILKHLGGDKALPWLIDLYKRAGNYHRVYRLGESRGGGGAGRRSARDEGTRAMWEAAYPRAYQPLVEKYGAAAGNPELFLYAIMRKESGFDPHDVSYADARGLLQMIPPTSTQVAAGDGRAVLPRPALRTRDQRPPGRPLHRPALRQVRPRAAADRRRVQRRARA